jgi:polysaccharide biosynthesis transport protein
MRCRPQALATGSRMLQIDQEHSFADRDITARESVSQADLLDSIVKFIRRRLLVILFATALATVVGAIYLFITPSSYSAKATVVIDARKIQLFQQQSLIGDVPVDAGLLDSQVEILKSENVILPVIKDFRLADDPEFVGLKRSLVGTLLQFATSVFKRQEANSEFERTRRALREIERRLNVKRVRLTYVIEISFWSFTPERAAEIANAIVDAYIVDQLEAKYQATRRAGVWLQDRIEELRRQSAAAERAVVEFKRQNNIVDTGGRLMTEQQLAELNSQLVLAGAQRAEMRARLDRIEEIIQTDIPDATVADTLRNDVITKLRSQYLDLANREAELSERYRPDHLAAVNLRNQKREIRRSIVDELRRIAETYKSDYEIATQREAAIKEGLTAVISQSQMTNEAQVALRELESSALTYRELYDNFLQRYMESIQQQSFPIAEARVISKASRPLERSYPRTVLILAISGIGGITLGFGLAILRDLSDRVLRTRAQIETMLEMDCLAVVPIVKERPATDLLSEQGSTADPMGDRIIAQNRNLSRVITDAPRSRFAESIRSIKMAVDLSGDNRVIGLTSSVPEEGKSTIAAALAQVAARAGARVILVDCDLRNPSLSRELSPRAKLGILDVIAGKASLEDAVWKEPSSGITFLPTAINGDSVSNTNEILASCATKEFFRKLREMYEYVIVDVPPLEPIVDVRATTHLMDSYVFVIQWGRITGELIEQSLRSARSVRGKILGAVFNKTNLHALTRYEGQRGAIYQCDEHDRYGRTA